MIAQCENGNNAINIELSTTETYRDIVPQRLGTGRVSGIRQHHARLQQLLPLLHRALHTRKGTLTRCGEHTPWVADLHGRGFKEVTLLGQNVNSYGLTPSGQRMEGGVSFAELLRKVAQSVPDMRVRFTTSNPEDMTEDILHAIAEAEPLQAHTLPGTKWKQQDSETHEPQIHAGAIHRKG